MPIRISDNYLSTMLVNDLNRSLGKMLEYQLQAGSMQRIHDFADDPRGVGAIQRYQDLITNNNQYLRNLNRSRVIIDNTDTALQDLSGLLAEVREVVLRESSALATTASRATAQIEVDNFTNRMLDVLNTTVEGNYIFAGNRTDTVPFVRNGDTVIYQGNDETMTAAVGPDSSQALNIPGTVFMGALSSTLGGRADLAPRLDPTTLLDDISLGAGWEPGSIEIRDGNNQIWSVDLNGASTIDDVLTAIATQTGGAVTAAIDPDGTSLQLSGTGPLVVSEIGDGQTATTLGINGSSDAATLEGRDIRPSLQGATLLADVPSLAGSLPLGSIEVETGGVITTIDLSGAVTMNDVKTTFEAAMPGFELRLDTGGVSVISGSTEAFFVRNSGSPDTATLLGIEGTGSPVRMFGVLEDLRNALAADDPDAVRAVLVELEELEQMIQSQLITVGGRELDVAWTESLLMQRDVQLQAKLSLERDADVAEVSAALAQAETSYQASLLVSSKLFQTNLMMYL
jgi:flagellin-like hook-associated protein FlgL